MKKYYNNIMEYFENKKVNKKLNLSFVGDILEQYGIDRGDLENLSVFSRINNFLLNFDKKKDVFDNKELFYLFKKNHFEFKFEEKEGELNILVEAIKNTLESKEIDRNFYFIFGSLKKLGVNKVYYSNVTLFLLEFNNIPKKDRKDGDFYFDFREEKSIKKEIKQKILNFFLKKEKTNTPK